MIPAYFENRDIFITGGSGVVGKALIEMLLRTCNVNRIFILLRNKKGMNCDERLEKLKTEKIFRKLKTLKADVLDLKLFAIPGDAELSLLGISPHYADILSNVSVVYHCAATVRFDESLKRALKLNVGGTWEALKFSQTLKNLEVFMYISTFFSNPYLSYVEAKIYDAPMDWRFCLDLIERPDFHESQLDAITRKLTIGFPNTYCFTKNLAEALVNDYMGQLPLAIYRPSIVTCAINEPEPGFASTFMGSTGVGAACSAGLLKVVYANSKVKLDFTAQDVGTKVLLYQTVKTVQMYRGMAIMQEVPVYNVSSCTHCDVTIGDLAEMPKKYRFYEKASFEKSFMLPGTVNTSNIFVYMFRVFLQQLLPALLADFLLVMCGRQAVLMHLQRKIFHNLDVMKPFMFNQYYSTGVTGYETMKKDLKNSEFYCKPLEEAKDYMNNVDWSLKMLYSVREVLLNEDPKTIPKSRLIFKIKTWLYNLLLIFLFLKLYHVARSYIKSFIY